MSYAVFFDKDELTIRLPVNPEKIEISKSQTIEKYNVLGMGQVARQTGTELDKYSFEAEIPGSPYSYVLTPNGFLPAEIYLELFETWRRSNEPVRLVIVNEESKDISTLVLMESLSITENAGEEGDYVVSFGLTEYRPFGMKEVVITTTDTGAQKATVSGNSRAGSITKPNSYTVVKGDTLWSIAKKYLGDGSKYPELVKANPQIKNPNLIKVGQVIRIP